MPPLCMERRLDGALQETKPARLVSVGYARPAKLLASDREQAVEETFNDLTIVASRIRREISLAELQDWLRRHALLAHADVKALRNLLGLMDALEIF